MIIHIRPMNGPGGFFTAGPRIIAPYRAFARRYPACTLRCENPTTQLFDAGERIFIFHRAYFKDGEAEQNIPRLLAAGYLTVMEIDDHPEAFDAAAVARSFAAVHAVQVSTAPLAVEARRANPEVAVFPNRLEQIAPLAPPRGEGPLDLLYAAFNREAAWRPLVEPLQALLRRRPADFRLTVMSDRGFFDAVDAPTKRFISVAGQDVYRRHLRAADVMLAPLDDGPVSRCKSDLKFIESAAEGAVLVASPTVYADSVVDGRTGFLFQRPEEAVAILERLADDRGLLAQMRAAAWRYAAERRLADQHAGARYAWYRSLLRRQAPLTRALLARRPDLAPAASVVSTPFAPQSEPAPMPKPEERRPLG